MAEGTITKRPDSLLNHPELRAALLDQIARGVPATVALKAAGLSPHTIADWTHAAQNGIWKGGAPVHPECLPVICAFIAAVDMARAQHEAELIRRIYAAGDQVTNDKTGAKDWRANAWILNNNAAYRDRWHPEYGPNKTINILQSRGNQDLATMTEADLLEIASPEWKEILTPLRGAEPALLPEGKPDGT